MVQREAMLRKNIIDSPACRVNTHQRRTIRQQKPALHMEGAVPDWDQERLFDRPGHIGYGGGGPFAETFVRIGRPSAR